jgi:N-methylhydantoinase B
LYTAHPAVIERTRHAPWALAGGLEGLSNRGTLHLPGGERTGFAKATRVRVPAGALVELETGGGGGYGHPGERDPELVRADLREGYVSEAHARVHHPQAFA